MRGQRVVRAHQDHPALLHVQADELVLADVHGLEQQPDVQQAAVHLLRDQVRRGGVEVEADAGIALPEAAEELRQQRDGGQLAAADGDAALHQLILL